jgi:uncharacterized repeat protein (TIGR03843 family)
MTGPFPAPEGQEATVADAAVLSQGEVQLRGRVLPASNLTFFGEVTWQGQSVGCVYKPVTGERPLWDFPDGTLAAREVAAYLVSQSLGWGVVPLTLLRDGPLGLGMVQRWCEPDREQDPVDIVMEGEMPPGYRHVLDALDAGGTAVSLVHEDTPPLRRMAVFDVVVNNADRKGGHVLAMADGHRFGVDHGVGFHVDDKLRTVLWGWADESLTTEEVEDLGALRGQLQDDEALAVALRPLLSAREVVALRGRVRRLLARGRMPVPSGQWPSIPWPAF